MDLYVRLWPVWLLLASLSVNFLVAFSQILNRMKAEATVSNVVAYVTACLLAIASVVNAVFCMFWTFGAP